MISEFGPAFEKKKDGVRVRRQIEIVRDMMLSAGEVDAALTGNLSVAGVGWRTLAEIEKLTKFPQGSVSADLRHLRKARHGAYIVEKRRRGDRGGTWEYRVMRPPQKAQAA